MKLKIAVAVLLGFLAPLAGFAQNEPSFVHPQLKLRLTAHAATMSWTEQNAPATLLGYNVYMAPCTGSFTPAAGQPANAPAIGTCSAVGAFTKVTGSPIPAGTTTFTDSTIGPGQQNVYEITAVCPTSGPCIGESAPSNQLAGFVPGVAPNAPVLTITSVQ